jgi:hypothetical protein
MKPKIAKYNFMRIRREAGIADDQKVVLEQPLSHQSQ